MCGWFCPGRARRAVCGRSGGLLFQCDWLEPALVAAAVAVVGELTMGRFVRLLFSGAVAGVATLGFVGAVGANLNGLVLVLFAGFWLGLHAFFGFVRLSRRMDQAMRLTLMSSAEYDRLDHGSDVVGFRQP